MHHFLIFTSQQLEEKKEKNNNKQTTTTTYLFIALKKVSHANHSTLLVTLYYHPSGVLSQQKPHLPLLKP